MTVKSSLLAVLILGLITPCGIRAQDFESGGVLSVIEENDLIFDTDRHYTQGVRISYLGADNRLPDRLRRFSDSLPSIGYDKRADRIGFVIGQNIYTPGNTAAKQLLPWDRPYAGWLYGGFVLQRRGLTADRWVSLESLQLDLGVIGPESLAKEAQTWVHEIRGFHLPQGWSNQLKTEPGICLKYYRALRLSSPATKRHLDFIPHAGGALGNVETSLRGGGILRIGVNLPDDFGVQTISSLLTSEGGHVTERVSLWGVHVFFGTEGWVVGHSAFLDGNLFRSSHSVEREVFVAEIKTGLVVDLSRVQLAVSYVSRSPEFTGQSERNRYGSVSAKVEF
jgi:lipid A 3-O-deacylase